MALGGIWFETVVGPTEPMFVARVVPMAVCLSDEAEPRQIYSKHLPVILIK